MSAILVGVDGSTSSLRAAAYAAGLARRQRCRLIAVYVRKGPPTMIPLGDDSGAAAATAIEAQDEIERELRAAFRDHVPQLDIEASFQVRTGEPYAELIAAAKEARADAVIVGKSAKVLHRIAGSLAVKLVRCGRWPVTVVP
ncbi:universal stress protein [Paractinoplanes atraurantiacus]|uniref:Nucleotide-binding universal stress protein, UspA family n=1 Tax=Paractinoplanes atraurantiacus TaxID=1036182 RepID=A0A285JP84_9ACTN|nr:universal stress protein [Actinoplanes atraurantiacus]SNY60881.1 Nucleotide-binding universal stress protein, UspA family [Actinoplanes atraurantiacus]